jgi:hypothetical protein
MERDDDQEHGTFSAKPPSRGFRRSSLVTFCEKSASPVIGQLGAGGSIFDD